MKEEIKDWEKEFDEIFTTDCLVPDVERKNPKNGKYVTVSDIKGFKNISIINEQQDSKEIKDFIKTLLQQQHQKDIEKIEKLQRYVHTKSLGTEKWDDGEWLRRSDVLNILKAK